MEVLQALLKVMGGNAMQVPMAMHVQSVRLLSLLYIDAQATNQPYTLNPTSYTLNPTS